MDDNKLKVTESSVQFGEVLEVSNKKHMRASTKRRISNIAGHTLLVIMSFIWLIPFVLLVLHSFECNTNTMTGNILPVKWGFDNYVRLFTEKEFPTWFINTLVISLFTCVIQTFIVLCMSYTLSRMRFKGRKFLMNFMLILGMFPGMLTMIILYRVLADLGMTQSFMWNNEVQRLGSIPGMILVYTASSGMGYYVSKGFFDTIPKSLDEAARVDGANRAQVLFKVILPLSKPIVIYTLLTAFMGPWGDFVFAKYIAFNDPKGMNVAVGLHSMVSSLANSDYTGFCAGGVIVAIPVAVLFLFLQKYYVEGVTGGAVKG